MFTRPNISYVVQQVCLFMHDPQEAHFSALKRIFHFVRGTMVMVYNCFLLRHLLWLHILMLNGLVALILGGLLLGILCFLIMWKTRRGVK